VNLGKYNLGAVMINSNNASVTLPCVPDQSRPEGYKLCPIRNGDDPRCWGIRCAAFRPLNAAQGFCQLIERGAA
jgi:hypothetical protein